MSIEGILRGHDLFRSLNIEETNQLNRFSSVKKYAANEVIFKFNDAAGHIYMLMDGSVHLRLPADPQGFSLVISTIEKGELFGLSPLLASSRYTASAHCTVATEVLSIEARPFRELLQRNSPVGFNIMTQVAHIYFNRYIGVLKSLQGVVNQVSLIR